ncbi:MAG: ORF6C domain-containing protein [Limosilactobacillus mucosae]
MSKHQMAKRNSQIKHNNQIQKIKFSPELIQMLAEQQQTLQEGQTQQQRINKAMVEVFGNLTNESKQEIKAYTDAQLGRVDERIDRIEKMIPLTDGEAMMLKQVASKKAARLVKTILYRRFGNSDYGGHEFFNAKYGHVIRTVYSLLKHEFNVIKYTAILHVQFQDAMDFTNQITVESLPAKATRLTDKQVEKLNEWEERHGLSLTPKED